MDSYPKTIEAIERHDGKDLWAIGDALVREVGAKAAGVGIADGSAARFKRCAEEVAGKGFEGYSTARLRQLRDTASSFGNVSRLAFPFEVHMEARNPATLKAAIAEIRRAKGVVTKRKVAAYRKALADAEATAARKERERLQKEADKKRQEAERKQKEADDAAAKARTDADRKAADRKEADAKKKQDEADAAAKKAASAPKRSAADKPDIDFSLMKGDITTAAMEAKKHIRLAKKKVAEVVKAGDQDLNWDTAIASWQAVANEVGELLHDLQPLGQSQRLRAV